MKKLIKNNKIPFAIITAGILILIGILANISHKNNLAWQEEFEQTQREAQLDFCIEIAEMEYWEYMEINGRIDDDGVIYAENRFWDNAEENKDRDIDNCYRRYNLK